MAVVGMLWLGGVSGAQAAKKAKKPDEPKKHRFLPLPEIRTEPGMGIVFGVRGTYAYTEPGDPWSKVRLEAGARVSTKLVQRHSLDLVLRDLFGWQEILSIDAEYIRDPVYPYFGIANDAEYPKKELNREYYWVDVTSVGPSVVYQHPVVSWNSPRPIGVARSLVTHRSHLRLFGGYRFRYDRFRAFEDSRYAEEQSKAEQTVRRGSYIAGLSWDSRDDVIDTHWGAFHDVSVEPAGPWAGGSATWVRLNASTRFYRSIVTPKVVYAQQILVDAIIGDAPLLTMGEFGGLLPREGIGGRFIGRGFLRRRFVGKFKAAASVELRVAPHTFTIKGRTLTPGVKLFVDAGKVVTSGRAPLDDLHVSGGIGPYVVWENFFVLRFDIAGSPEGLGLYLSAAHAF